MKKLIFLLFLPFLGLSQKNIFLRLKPVFDTQTFQSQTVYTGNNGQEITLDYFKYYLADITIIHDGGQVLTLGEIVYLIDDANYTVYLGAHPVTTVEHVNFLIGVPKRFNTQSGALAQDISTYDASNALSFQSPSMYWGWSTGYMHMITGGKADGNNDNVPESYFELHNLGNNNQQMVTNTNVVQANTSANQVELNFDCHIDRWLNGINLATLGILHDETGLNITAMQNVNTQDVFDQPANADISIVSQSAIQFSSQQGAIQCTWTGKLSESEIMLFDSFGRELRKQSLGNTTGQFTWIGLTPGMYFVQYADEKGQAQSRQVLVF
ncbi:MAG: hypothetical protein RLZZ585_1626 [Bacteroidota bacterium]|jgi:hypothetical protein